MNNKFSVTLWGNPSHTQTLTKMYTSVNYIVGSFLPLQDIQTCHLTAILNPVVNWSVERGGFKPRNY